VLDKVFTAETQRRREEIKIFRKAETERAARLNFFLSTKLFSLRLCASAVIFLCLACVTAFGQEATAPKKNNARPPETVTNAAEPFDGASVEKMSGQCVTLETEAGVIEIEMLAEAAPESVRNFLNLAATGAFNTTTFSRVVKDFVIQGGNLSTSQTQTPALMQRARRTIPDEPNAVKHERGIVSMARPDTPNGATTSFFILVGDAPHLDGKFAAFGRVKRGMEIVDAINKAPANGEKPDKPVRLTRAVVAACAR
jgi:peptidyl-prolyl cis-trans isomerase B (cyclophilin B)